MDSNPLSQPGEDTNLKKVAEYTQQEIENNTGSMGSGLGIVLIGYTGAGKTTAADKMYDSLADNKVKPENIGKYNINETIMQSGYVVDLTDGSLVADALDKSRPFDEVTVGIIDGVCSFQELIVISQFFDNLYVLYLKAHGLARHSRLTEKPAPPSRDELMQRDEKYDSRGLDELIAASFYDTEIDTSELDESSFLSTIGSVTKTLYQTYDL